MQWVFVYKLKMAAKRVAQVVKMTVAAGQATPSPPLGPTLGQRGVNIGSFCKDFNEKTSNMKPGVPIPVSVTVNPDRSFTYVAKHPPVSYFLKAAAGVRKGSSKPKHEIVGSVSVKHIYEIAKLKSEDPGFEGQTMFAVCRCIAASARSMGIGVTNERSSEESGSSDENSKQFEENTNK